MTETQSRHSEDKTFRQALEQAYIKGGERYFEQCRQRVPGFCKRTFAYPGCWRTNRAGIGWDMLRTPLNLFWAPVYVAVCLLMFITRKIGLSSFSRILSKVPVGFTTDVQKGLCKKIYEDVLDFELGDTTVRAKGLQDCVASAFRVEVNTQQNDSQNNTELFNRIDLLVAQSLKQYNVTRTASSDITNVAASAVFGAIAFKQFTPGGLGLGMLLAAFIAKHSAINQFVFGQTLGTLYYSVFSPQPSLGLHIISTVVVLSVLAFFSSISGLISDPIQYRLRFHRRRLNKMIDTLERDYIAQCQSRFNPKDQYLARIFDSFDAIRSHLF